MRFALALVVLFTSTSSFGYNWRRCKAWAYRTTKVKDKPYTGRFFDDLMITTSESSLNKTTDQSVGASASVTSFVISSGPCRAFGMAHQERARYVAQTKNELQMEISEGHGDHVVALATLYGCNELGKANFTNIIRGEHSAIFNPDSDVLYQMTKTVADSQVLSKNCNPELI